MITNMALRFRDLVTDPGQTIANHQRIIDVNDYVWWGWWNKPKEKIPRNTFAHFRQLAASTELWLFLVDSGSEKLYKALLESIVESQTEDVIACPDAAKTPGYYSTARYKAWFRLKKIEEIPPDEIRKWSYCEVEEFLDDPAADRFQDKRVFIFRRCSIVGIEQSIFSSLITPGTTTIAWNSYPPFLQHISSPLQF